MQLQGQVHAQFAAGQEAARLWTDSGDDLFETGATTLANRLLVVVTSYYSEQLSKEEGYVHVVTFARGRSW